MLTDEMTTEELKLFRDLANKLKQITPVSVSDIHRFLKLATQINNLQNKVEERLYDKRKS